jgi:hypothetical protein
MAKTGVACGDLLKATMLKPFGNKTPCSPANAEPDQPNCQDERPQHISAVYENDYRVEGRKSGKAHHHYQGQNPNDSDGNEGEHPPEHSPQALCLSFHVPLTIKITDERHSRRSEPETDVVVAHSVHCLVKRFASE